MIEFVANPIIDNPTIRKGAEMLEEKIRNKRNCVFKKNCSQNSSSSV